MVNKLIGDHYYEYYTNNAKSFASCFCIVVFMYSFLFPFLITFTAESKNINYVLNSLEIYFNLPKKWFLFQKYFKKVLNIL